MPGQENLDSRLSEKERGRHSKMVVLRCKLTIKEMKEFVICT